MTSCTTPHMSVSAMARVGSLLTGEVANIPVMRDMMAVGPSVMSLDVPNTMYTKQPMNAEYRPY